MHLRVIAHGPHPPEAFCFQLPFPGWKRCRDAAATDNRDSTTTAHVLRLHTLTSTNAPSTPYSQERPSRLQLWAYEPPAPAIQASAISPRHTHTVATCWVTQEETNNMRAACSTRGRKGIANRSSNSSSLPDLSAHGQEHNDQRLSWNASSSPSRGRIDASLDHAPGSDSDPKSPYKRERGLVQGKA